MASEEGGCLPEETEFPPDKTDASGEDGLVKEAVRRGDWDQVADLVEHGVCVPTHLLDEVLTEALGHSKWRCVIMLATLGLSEKQRDVVFQEAALCSQWECVDYLLTLGVSEQERDLAFKRAVQQEQWRFAAGLIRAGISSKQMTSVVSTALSKCLKSRVVVVLPTWNSSEQTENDTEELRTPNDFAHLVELVRICEDPRQTDLVLKELINRCAWSCVVQLVREVNLSKEQTEFVFDEAVPCGLLECAIHLLKNGVSEDRERLIVQELFQRKGWHRVVDLIREGTLSRNMREFVFQTAVNCGHSDAAVAIVQLQPLSDLELRDVIIAAVNSIAHPFLHHIITHTRNGREAFQQLCLMQQWIQDKFLLDIYANLLKAEEKELALYLAATHYKWPYVSSLCQDSSISKEGRVIPTLLQTVANFEDSDATIAAILQNPLTELELCAVMISAVKHANCPFLLNILKHTTHGRRVFKQLCMKQQFRDVTQVVDVYVSLLKSGEKELALFWAATQSRWPNVTKLYEDRSICRGVRRFVIQHAIKHGVWEQVIRLACASVTRESDLHLVFLEAVRRGKWRWALQLCKKAKGLRVSKGDLKFTLLTLLSLQRSRGVIEVCRYFAAHVPPVFPQLDTVTDLSATIKEIVNCLKPDGIDSSQIVDWTAEHTEFLLRAFIKCREWRCVTQIVKLLPVTVGQKEYVCDQALSSRAVKYAAELLKHGVSEHQSRRIVRALFDHDKCHLILQQVQEGTADKTVMRLAFETAIERGNCDVTVKMMRLSGVTGRELNEAITTKAGDGGLQFLQNIISHLRQHRPESPAPLTEKPQSEDRTQIRRDIMSAVHDNDDRLLLSTVSTETGRSVFKEVCSSQQWKDMTVVLRLYTCLAEANEADLAFCVARTNELWVCVEDLSESDSSNTCVAEYCRDMYFPGVRSGRPLIKMAVKTAIKADHLECFVSFLDQCRRSLNEELLQYACSLAIDCDKCHFVLAICRSTKKHSYVRTVQKLASQLGIRAEKWNFMTELVVACDVRLSAPVFLACIRKVIHETDSWEPAAPFLEELCKGGTVSLHTVGKRWRRKDMTETADFANWCKEAGFYNLAVCLYLFSKDWKHTNTVLETTGRNVATCVIIKGADIALAHGKCETAAICFNHLEQNDYHDLRRTIHGMPEETIQQVIDKCREKGYTKGVLYLAMFVRKWDTVGHELETCQDQTLINAVIRKAATSEQWSVLVRHLSICSLDTNGLADILRSAVSSGQSEKCVQILLEKVDPRSATSYGNYSLLCRAVESREERERMLRLCIASGLSTHQHHIASSGYRSPMRCALQNGQFPLVRLLHESGSSSSHEMHLLKNNASIRTQLESQNRQDIVQYVDQAAGNPRSLQSLCRLTVSHLVGCWPGRQDRVLSLPVAWCLHDYILFRDLAP